MAKSKDETYQQIKEALKDIEASKIKLTPEEKGMKERLKKQYMFQKLHKISYEKHKENQNLITDLPLIN